MSLTEAAGAVGLVPSTALRQLRALEAAGLLSRDEPDQLYRPGPQLVELSRRVYVGQSLAAAAQPFLDELAATSGESAYLAVADAPGHATYVATTPGTHALRHSGWLGRSFATRGTAVGAALRDDVERDGAIARRDALEDGITAISAPVVARGTVVAAISVVGPTFRLRSAARSGVRDAVIATARQLAQHLTSQPEP